MIHAIRNTNPTIFEVRPVQRLANQVYLAREKLTYLWKFKNDMNERVIYAYPDYGDIVDFGTLSKNYQYSECRFTQVSTIAAQDLYRGKICLEPAGFWYYEICEVYFYQTIVINWDGGTLNLQLAGYAPINYDNDFAPWGGVGPVPTDGATGNMGQLGIIVEEGKLQVKEVPNEVTYVNYEEEEKQNYIYNE